VPRSVRATAVFSASGHPTRGKLNRRAGASMPEIFRFLTAGESHGEALTAVITTYQESRAVKWLERAGEC
jgi:hypothetical protein